MEERNIEKQPRGGKLVVLEGDFDTIATQLRLLPPSPNILVLSSIIDLLESESSQEPFDARVFIRDVYLALDERIKTAQSFLKHSTIKQPRLVFANGASVYARSTCIRKISEKITNGHVQESETIFNRITRYGVARLLAEDTIEEEEAASEEEVTTPEVTVTAPPTESNIATHTHPNVSLTKATNALENDTATLQSSVTGTGVCHTQRLDNGDTAMTASTSEVPDVGVNSSKTKALTLTTATGLPIQPAHNLGDDLVSPMLALRDRRSVLKPRAAQGRRHSWDETRKSGYFGIDLADDSEFEEDDTLLSIPPTPSVVYGEAELVDVQTSTSEKQLKRAKSVDRSYANSPRWPTNPQNIPALLKHTNSAFPKGRPTSSVGFNEQGFQMHPRRTFIRASQTIIKKSPSSTRSTSSMSERGVKASVLTRQPQFVDRGTDAEVILEEEEYDEEEYEECVPVFPLTEDLVIQFTDSNRNEVVDSVIRSYKNGSYPVMPPLSEIISNRSLNIGLVAQDDTEEHRSHPGLDSAPRSETNDPGYESDHSYDPYSSKNGPFSSSNTKEAVPPVERISRADSGVQMPEFQMQSLNQPPPSPPNDIAEKFVELSTVDSKGTIFLQNSLRELLSHHLPAGENGYRQHPYQVSPEADRLWKPVFENDDNPSLGNEGRTLDQIICLGCETGVQKEFFCQIYGCIERLGMKRDGASRSAKLDINYLIANMMQSYSFLSPPAQSTSNPLCDSTLLATLLVPQIEAYLASNTTTRLLILHYPPSHLSTVFALRQLLGTDTLKIAGILNSLSSDPPSSVSRPKTAISKQNSNPLLIERAMRLRQGKSHPESLRTVDRKTSFANTVPGQKPSFNTTSLSKANFLLPSTATETEITTFLSGIRKCLVEKSSFYTPDPDPEPTTVESLTSHGTPPVLLSKKPPSGPETPPRQVNERMSSYREKREKQSDTQRLERNNNYPPVFYYPATVQSTTSRESKVSRLTGNTKASTAASITSINTKNESRFGDIRNLGRSGGADNRSVDTKGEKRPDGTWENFYIGDEDSDDDEFDKMILGRKHAKIVPEVRKVGGREMAGKRNKQKALKWLGLA